MKLNLLNVDNFTRGLKPVTTTELTTKTGEFHPDGLYSENIFGVEGSLERSRTFSFIELNTYVIHPATYLLLTRLEQKKLTAFFSTEENFIITDAGELKQDEDGISGIKAFIENFSKIKFRGGTPERERFIQLLQKAYKDKTLFINKLPIIPPDFRPMYQDEDGNWMIDQLTTDYYIPIMRRASQVKSVGEGSTLYNLLNYHLQITINNHDSYVRKKIAKKSGLIRSSMLGKRIDFSARGVIIPGPELDVNEIGLPLRMAVSLFQPFIFHYILFSKRYPQINELEEQVKNFTESELSVESLERVLKSIKGGDKVPDNLVKLIFDATEIIMKGRVILAKRDPALHEESYRAFYPRLILGDTIKICTLQVGGFNADFDGDQMALFHPLSRQAQQEAKDKLMRGVGAKHSNHVAYEISKEMAVGLYTLTKWVSRKASPVAVNQEILDKATDPYIPVRYKGRTTTIGRVIFNNAFPEGFRFIDTQITKKIVNGLIPEIIETYGDEVAAKVFSRLEKIGFKFATIMAPTITLDMIDMPDEILQLKEKLPNATPEEADKLLKQMEAIMKNHLKNTGLYDLVESGAGKGWGQPRQILIAKGVISDPKGNLLPPIKGSFSEGLKNTEYFDAAAGARKGLADRTLNTADTGYFTRQLVYVLGPVEAHPSLRDCGTKRTVNLRLTSDIMKRLEGRYLLKNGRITRYNKGEYKVGDIINLRSPIFCESMKICHTCYGDLLRRHRTPYVGVLAGAAIGERGTQLIMRTFHTGGAASVAEHDMIQNVIDNDPLIEVDIKKYLQQDEDKLITTKPCTVTIDISNYRINDNIQFKNDVVWVNHLLSKVEYDDVLFNIILDYPIEVQPTQMNREDSKAIFKFNSGDIILTAPLQTTEIKEQVNYVNRLLGGKVVYKDPSHMVTKVLGVYGGSISDLDLVHFEVLISQVLRDRSNKALPARLGKTWDPVMMNIKSAVFQSGFLQGLAFENVNKAIETGLINEDMMPPSILGRVLTGDLIE